MRLSVANFKVSANAPSSLAFSSRLMVAIPTDAFFETLWVQGIFQEINVACGINISDYEEAILPFEKIASAQKVLRETKAIDGKVLDFCQRFEGALASALASKRNVFFVF